MIDTGDSEVVQESPRESLFIGRYFVSGRGIVSGSGIAKRFKDPALFFTCDKDQVDGHEAQHFRSY